MDGRVGGWRELGVSDGFDRAAAAAAGLSERCTFLRKAKTYLVQLRRLLLTRLSGLLLWPGTDCQQGKFQKTADGREGRHTNSVRRPFSVTFRITYATSYAPINMCHIPRTRSRTPVGNRAISTVASGPNQFWSLYLRTSSRIPSLGIIKGNGVPSRGGLMFLEARMAVAGHQDAPQCFSVGQSFPFRFVRGSVGEAGYLVSAFWS
jgi:hypothetical protein